MAISDCETDIFINHFECQLHAVRKSLVSLYEQINARDLKTIVTWICFFIGNEI